MFSSIVRRTLLQSREHLINSGRRSLSSAPSQSPLTQWYNIFGSSNVAYVGFIVVGLVVTETIYGYSTDALWNSINHGKTFETVDWSKFVVDDDDDDDDEDEEEEEEEEDDE